MTTRTDAATVREILETALKTTLDGLENPAREEIEAWDSLTHIELVFLLEEQFDVRFTEEEIRELTSQAAILSMLQDKHAT